MDKDPRISHYTDGMSQLNMNSPQSPSPKLLSVSMHLGVSVHEQEDGTWAASEREGNVVWESLKGLRGDMGIEFLQIGWVGRQVPRAKHDALATELMLKHSCHPLFLTEQESEDFYHRFCKGVLWPTMNYSLANSRRFQGIEGLWRTYNKVMHYIADSVATHYRAGDVIWIHDYHLLCLPAFIRSRIPHAKIGFFLHCTFPSSELFRQIPIRESLLLGLCAADVIGFQTYNYCRYFLRSVSVLLDWHNGPTGVTDPSGKVTRVFVNPTGLTVSLYTKKLLHTDVQEKAERWRALYPNMKIVVGRCTRLDKYQGMVEKLLAFDHFLTTHPEYIGKVMLMQSILDNEQVHAYETCSSAQVEEVHEERSLLTERVQQLVGRINGSHGTLGWQPIHIYIKAAESIENSLALDRIADVVMITPTRDGMNLIAHESILATKETHAPLILSEFAGAASCLGGSIIVNPYDKAGMAEALKKALEMSSAEKAKNHSYNLRYVTRKTSGEWARTCVEEIIRESQRSRTLALKGNELETFLKEFGDYSTRLVLIDYECTLKPPQSETTTTISNDVKQALLSLATDPRTTVYILSGATKETMEDELAVEGEVVPFGLCCQNGLHIRRPHAERWEYSEQGLDTSWKETVRKLLHNFKERTPGTEVYEENTSIAWQYGKADQGFAKWLVKDLVLVLHQLADQFPIAIAVTKSSVECRPQSLTRSTLLRNLLSRYHAFPVVYYFGTLGTEAMKEAFVRGTVDERNPQGELVPQKFIRCAVGAADAAMSECFVSDMKEVPAVLSLMHDASLMAQNPAK